MIAVRRSERHEFLAAVGGFPCTHVQHVNEIGVFRIGKDVMVIPRPHGEFGIVSQMTPGLPGIVGSIDAFLSRLRVDERPYALQMSRRDRDADSSFKTSGIPGLLVSSVQVSPPSVVSNTQVALPALRRPQGKRWSSSVDAYRMLRFVGSITRSAAPACSPWNRTFRQVRPPSLDRNTPRSVRDVAPVDAAIIRLPDPAASGSKIEDLLIYRISRNGYRLASSRRSDHAPVE